MQYRSLRRKAAVSLVTVALAAGVATPAGPSSDAIDLQPEVAFDLSSDPSMKILDFAACRDGLYFLVEHSGASLVLRTDVQGTVTWRTGLPLRRSTTAGRIAVSESGSIGVIRHASGVDHDLVLLEPLGVVQESAKLDERIFGVAYRGENLMAASQSSVFAVSRNSQGLLVLEKTATITPTLEYPFEIHSMPSGALEIVEYTDARIREVSPAGDAASAPFELDEALFGRVEDMHREQAAARMFSAAASASGALYFAVSGFRLPDGADVVERLPTGARRVYRAHLPRRGSLISPTNQEGYLRPLLLRADESRFYLSDLKSPTVAVYRLR